MLKRRMPKKLADAYKTKLQLNIFDIREDLINTKLEDCDSVDAYASKINGKVAEYNLCAEPTDTDATTADTIPKMSKQEHVFYLFRGIPRDDDWRVILEIMRDKSDSIATKPEEVVTKLIAQEAAIKREKGLAPEAQIFAKNDKGKDKGKNKGKDKSKKSGKGKKNNGSESSSSSSSDSEDEQYRHNWKDIRECFLCHENGHIAHFCPKKRVLAEVTQSTAKAATDTTPTTTIENFWMTGSAGQSGNIPPKESWYLDSATTSHIVGNRQRFIPGRYTEYDKCEEREIRDFHSSFHHPARQISPNVPLAPHSVTTRHSEYRFPMQSTGAVQEDSYRHVNQVNQ
ncbi:hypothetical protein BDD12DRAFT_856103 [Trichophaea hybrida]|nr:hypothetical protein BDD12DRAFT_856103 [Trichophaea hybrida]